MTEKSKPTTAPITAEQWSNIGMPAGMQDWQLQMVNPDGLVRYERTVGEFALRVQELYDGSQFSWRASTDAGFLVEGYASSLDQAMQAAEAATHPAPAPATYQIKRITRAERMYTPPPASVTPVKPAHDLDLQRLNASVVSLPAGLRMEFRLKMDGTPDAFYISKTKAGTHWAIFAMHVDPLYGELTGRSLPRQALKFCGRAPWATIFAIAHEVPAWCERIYPDPKRLPHTTLVSDITGLAAPNVDPILYGVMIAGPWWGFVKLAEWKV